jgi:hypothetical protein
MTAICLDCGDNTTPNDDRRRRDARRSEWYMVHDHVWLAAGMPQHDPTKYGDEILCIGCLEVRLGRRLTPHDFTESGINQLDRWHSERLNARLAGATR